MERQCNDYQEFGYHCVPYYQCNDNNIIKTDGAGLIGPRSGGFRDVIQEEAENSKCGSLLEVCCQHSSFSTTTTLEPVTKKRDKKQLSRKICSYFGLACIEPTSMPTIATPIVDLFDLRNVDSFSLV